MRLARDRRPSAFACRTSEDEVCRHQRVQSVQSDVKVGELVAVGVTFHEGIAGHHVVAKLAGNTGKGLVAEEREPVVGFRGSLGVQELKVDEIAIELGKVPDHIRLRTCGPYIAVLEHERIGVRASDQDVPAGAAAQPVHAFAAVDLIVAAPAVDIVAARSAIEPIIAVAPTQHIIAEMPENQAADAAGAAGIMIVPGAELNVAENPPLVDHGNLIPADWTRGIVPVLGFHRPYRDTELEPGE